MGTQLLLCKNWRAKIGQKNRQDCTLHRHDVPRIVYTQAIVQRHNVTLEDLSDSHLSQMTELTVASWLHCHELQHQDHE